MSTITDLRHLPGHDNLDVPPEAQRLTNFIRAIVGAATCWPSGPPVQSALRCRRRLNRRPCTGHLIIRRQDVPSEIHWRCPVCADSGMVHHWRGSMDDFSEDAMAADQSGACTVLIAEPDYQRLRETVFVIDREPERVIKGARLGDGGVVLTGSADDLDDLMGWVAAEANHAQSKKVQKALDRVFEQIQQVLHAQG